MKIEIAVEKLREVIRRKHFSIATEENYAQWLRRFSVFVRERCESDWNPEQKMEAFLTQLARQDVSASTQNQSFCALLFFYREVMGVKIGKVDSMRAKKPGRLRYAPERAEVMALLERVQDSGGYPTRLIVHLIYGCGLRVSEAVSIRLKDVLLSESKMILRAAKGDKDRMVALPCSLFRQIETQMDFARVVAAQDMAARLPVQLPGMLAKKYPHWQFSPKWAFLFPGRQSVVHPRAGHRVRYHVLEVNIQRCVRAAARPLGLEITPHHLRHAYATHCLNAGQNPRAIQSAMGHVSLETTMGYLHAESLSVRSPLEFASISSSVQ